MTNVAKIVLKLHVLLISESKHDVTVFAHHAPVKFDIVSAKPRMHLSQNNAYKLNKLPTPAGQETSNLSSKALLF